MREVVICINVLKQAALFKIAHTGGRSIGVKLVGDFIRARVKLVIIHALVYPHAPENYARMISVLQYHLAQVFAGLLLPLFVPKMLPAGKLREH